MKLYTKTNESFDITISHALSTITALWRTGIEKFPGHEIRTNFGVELVVYQAKRNVWYILDKATGISILHKPAQTMHSALHDMIHIIDTLYSGSIQAYKEQIRIHCDDLYSNRIAWIDKKEA